MVRAMDSEHPPRPPAGASLTRLVDIMARLLGPGGCPWDREQTLDTLRIETPAAPGLPPASPCSSLTARTTSSDDSALPASARS